MGRITPTTRSSPGDDHRAEAEPAAGLSTATTNAILETRLPLSLSLIWRRQSDFYVQRGIKAWSEDRVPEYITNNPFFADLCAKIVLSFLQDCKASSASGGGPPL